MNLRTAILGVLAATATAFIAGLVAWALDAPAAAAGCLLGASVASVAFPGFLVARGEVRLRRPPATPEEIKQLRLAEQLISAEQDERRRISILLHDGPLQSLSGIALMHDAAIAALDEGRSDDALEVMHRALEKKREAIQILRDLSLAIEPLVLRDYGFDPAVRAIAEVIERDGQITVSLDVETGEELAEKAQVAVYQVIREALTQATRRRPSRISVEMTRESNGTYAVQISDDGMAERHQRNAEAIDERARTLNGKVSLTTGETMGTSVRVTLPGYVAAPIADVVPELEPLHAPA